jgi:hypothetical protein
VAWNPDSAPGSRINPPAAYFYGEVAKKGSLCITYYALDDPAAKTGHISPIRE